jgi:hypothetical protein
MRRTVILPAVASVQVMEKVEGEVQKVGKRVLVGPSSRNVTAHTVDEMYSSFTLELVLMRKYRLISYLSAFSRKIA